MGNSQKKQSKPRYDPSSKGPIKERGCTDILCCILFVLLFLGMIAVGLYGFIKGDVTRILHPTDSQGNQCGLGKLKEKPFLFFFDLTDCFGNPAASLGMGCPTPQVCVEKCPTETWTWTTLLIKEKITNFSPDGRKKLICKDYPDGIKIDPLTTHKDLSASELIKKGYCASYYVPSEEVLGRCIPKLVAGLITDSRTAIVNRDNKNITATDLQKGSLSVEFFSLLAQFGLRIYQDLVSTWWLILIFLAAAMLLSLLWIVMMRCLAAPMVVLSIICFIGLFGFATYYFFSTYVEMKDNPAHQGGFILTTNLQYYWNLANTYLALGIIALVILVITLLLLIFLRQRIRISIALIKESSRAVGKMMSTLLWPIFPFLLHLIIIAFWGASAVYLTSVGKLRGIMVNSTEPKDILTKIPCDPNTNDTAGKICDFIRYGGDQYLIYLQAFMLFMLFWVMHFIVAINQTSLAGAFASYYWAWDKAKDIPTFPLLASFGRCFRYHLGSLAFGSLILALVHMVRVILEYIEEKLKGAENAAAKCMVKCLKCLFWCLEKVLKMLTRNAYIMIAVYGKNFCTSARRAFTLIANNIVRAVVLDKVTDFLLFIGKMMVVGAVGVPSFYILKRKLPIAFLQELAERYIPNLNYYIIPVIIICVGAYMIASSFLGVYAMAVDTLFLCFLEDEERHDGSEEKPYYMSGTLKKILGKKNKSPAEDDPDTRM